MNLHEARWKRTVASLRQELSTANVEIERLREENKQLQQLVHAAANQTREIERLQTIAILRKTTPG